MIYDKKVVAIVPARGGSKGLPGKNIRNFCGRPLISHAIEVAKKSKYIDRIFVSTDCEDIMAVAHEFGGEIHLRPADLATDTALVSDTIRHFLSESNDNFDYLVLLEATSPLRTSEQVDQCIEILANTPVDSVATFSKAEPPPTRLWKIVDGVAKTYLEHANPWLPRQQQDEAIYLNGLVYAFDIKEFVKSETKIVFFGESSAIVTDSAVVDIDTLDDFILAEFLMEKKNETI